MSSRHRKDINRLPRNRNNQSYPLNQSDSFMKRRTFVQASLATLCTTTASQSLAADQQKRQSVELYELRSYSLKTGKQPLLDDYLEKALLPALKKFEIGPVGVFHENLEKDGMKVHVLIVHRSAEDFASLPARLAADEEHRTAAGKYLGARPNEAVYTRIDSSLMAAIEGMPHLAKTDPSKPRLLNLRIYESHNERAGKKKIEMFNKAELAIFRRVGLTPVFFGETIVGASMPNLTYMLVFPDEAGRKEAWNRFRDDEEWKKLRAVPEYADKEIVSNITNKILTPAAYSEI